MIRAVFDTNIFFQAILSETGPSRECVESVLTGQVSLISSQEIEDEFSGIISRPKLVAKYAQLRGPSASRLITLLFKKAEFRLSPKATFKLERDPADEVFLNLAIQGAADYLVTRDNDLLDLMDDSEFCSKFPELKIVNPVAFLNAVRAE